MTQPKSPGAGHNAALDQKLLTFLRQAENVQQEIDEHKEDMKTIMGTAKAAGYKPKYVRLMLKMRKMERELLDLQLRETNDYMAKVGLAGTPLGDAAQVDNDETAH